MSDGTEMMDMLRNLLAVPEGVGIIGSLRLPSKREMAETSLSMGLPVVEMETEGKYILVMPLENADVVAELIHSRRMLKNITHAEKEVEGIGLLLEGEPACLALMCDQCKKNLQELAAHALDAYAAELKAYAKDSGSAAAELENVQSLSGDDVIKWFISHFADGAKPAGCLSAAVEECKQRFSRINDIFTSTIRKRGRRIKKKLARNIAELVDKLPEGQRDLTEIPVVRLPLDVVRELMVASTGGEK